ncbi:hypothetical protein CO112_01350 [Candidatus Dojkabacteria bacterium CG_4_9_14_3_um_filter_150_Dojkabacteria_WS6_41_13]|uniref:Transcription regulator TrmB N-terminal domain-containing protein n=1 Tax=Candidatus Dojkabacteria bacterium CG_4_10_14_0_2_um_filter_Dojkabacteria_WS6_41_15 TaxID=2014249 RepID=A0A2M7W260_9BACT|nr:MAG: hypothetical protein COZ14_03715 [Candidatus Dojkabacteria bacterium CG_4_10_14_3_um_filter_Dojkabacteria_WS6_41_9]PJA14417.1 MAG: hypothetical protein COX64_02050 [Candidatus Dojkabacteria bacterium CG_4_10_14_0_2_um_filter_Dojkabacteria_WS6_41_15]PJB23231.1 MAG: hypothetical protein CO112_01350 [Candidatus Dojkabacteria bacterium CG_4_9_14_3_um_filter_150_Dojkabacteria_WS6_41_13]
MQLKKSLEELGLTQNEITVYTYLVSKGESYGNQIYKDNSLDKSASYKAITALISKGFIVSSADSRNQLYKISPKEKIVSIFKQKKAEVENSKLSFLTALADVEQYSADHYHDENVQVFTGADAIDRYHRELIKGDVTLIRDLAASSIALAVAGDKKQLDKTMSWFIKERVSRGIQIRVMYDKESTPDEYDVSNVSLLKECRRYQKILNHQSMFSTFGDRVGFTTLKNGKYWALVIKDPLIVGLLNSIYDAMWEESEIV